MELKFKREGKKEAGEETTIYSCYNESDNRNYLVSSASNVINDEQIKNKNK